MVDIFCAMTRIFCGGAARSRAPYAYVTGSVAIMVELREYSTFSKLNQTICQKPSQMHFAAKLFIQIYYYISLYDHSQSKTQLVPYVLSTNKTKISYRRTPQAHCAHLPAAMVEAFLSVSQWHLPHWMTSARPLVVWYLPERWDSQ